MRNDRTGAPGDEERIGRRIANARKLRGLTQQQLAQRVPCSKSLIAQVERGHKPATPREAQNASAVAKAAHDFVLRV